jgi:hypothetical protein
MFSSAILFIPKEGLFNTDTLKKKTMFVVAFGSGLAV